MRFIKAGMAYYPPTLASPIPADLPEGQAMANQLSANTLQNIVIGLRTVLDQTGTYILQRIPPGFIPM